MDSFHNEDPNSEHFSEEFHPVEEAKPSFWRKLGGGSLSISILIHSILLVIGVVWVYQVIPKAEEPAVDFMPAGGGGGTPGEQVTQQKKRASMTSMDVARTVAVGQSTGFTLPEPSPNSTLTSVGALSAGGMSGGLGGSGSGGGRGDGHGTGFGSGFGPGLGGSATGGMNPFGMINPNANALVGYLYDSKQDPKRKSLGESGGLLETLAEFTSRGWNRRIIDSKFYRASQKLYQTKIYIPTMSADQAPKAFNAEKEVEPKQWFVIYSGNVVAPKSGRFRFFGVADDLIAVRFNRKMVFEYGYFFASTGARINTDVVTGKTENKAYEKELKDTGLKMPVPFYKYDTVRSYDALGGLAGGHYFDVKAGQTYPIEIIISEVPGGNFGAVLMIEEQGAEYKKSSTGSPILPVFRTDNSLPPADSKDGAPPYDPTGPIWKVAQGTTKEI
jgi:hypothetical protein